MAEEGFQEKSEPATAKRRSESRQKGSVCKSTEVNSVLVLTIALVMFLITGKSMMENMAGFLRHYIMLTGDPDCSVNTVVFYFTESWWLIGKVCLPIVLAILAIGLFANYIQVGWLLTLKPLVPNFSKINPIPGLKRLISLKSVVEAVKSSLKIIIIGLVIFFTVAAEFGRFLHLADTSVGTVWTLIVSLTIKVLIRVIMILILLAILDYIYQKYQYEKQLRMTKEEVKEERKQMEGDPQIKSRIRRVQLEVARRRMMKEVPKATVVVTNPTYIAIALRYEPEEMDAPLVLAKGKRLIAERIRAIATENGIPIIEDKPLARAMYDKVQPGETIPGEFFTAVAEIMAYVYRLKNKVAA